MLEVNPVLAGTFDSPAYTPAINNIARAGNAGAAGDTADTSSTETSSADPRRYTQFDRSATDAGSVTNFSFGDFLDMVNPLEHIPVVSSIYRAVMDEHINPVSRVAGDVLYGGILGPVSAVLGGIGATGDTLIEAQTGKSAAGNVIAALFGPDSGEDDNPNETQVAQTGDAAAAAPSAAAGAPIPLVPQKSAPAAAVAATAPAVSPLSSPQALAYTLNRAKAFPLTPNKLPYGGVLAPPASSNKMQQEDTAIALSEASHAMRLGHMIYTGRFMNGPKPMPVMQPKAAASAPAPAAVNAAEAAAPTSGAASNNAVTTATAATAQSGTLPQSLINDMIILKALGQYNDAGNTAANAGTNLDVRN